MNSRDFGREKLRRFGSYMEIISETTVIDKEIEGIIEEGNNNSVIYIYISGLSGSIASDSAKVIFMKIVRLLL